MVIVKSRIELYLAFAIGQEFNIFVHLRTVPKAGPSKAQKGGVRGNPHSISVLGVGPQERWSMGVLQARPEWSLSYVAPGIGCV